MKKLLLVFMLVSATLFTSVWAGDNPRAVIIFDASGSMWGQINGVTKIEIAKNALKRVVREWNPDVELGLTLYGHRFKGDCNDIETVIPVGKIDKNRVISTVMSIKPKGKTPISRTLRKVAEEIKYTEEKATIILISDGKETCDPDPCGTAKELEKQGIDFVTHVIGFNVDKKTSQQLECIADATGGEYFSAKNAAALNKAMKVIAKKVEKPKPVVRKTILSPVIRYSMSPNVINIPGVQLEVMQEGKTIYRGSNVAPNIEVKVGSVHMKVSYNRTSKSQTMENTFTLPAQKQNSVEILLNSGQVTIDTAEEQGGSKVKSSVRIYPVIEGEPNMSDQIVGCEPTKIKACKKILPTGDFLITASYNGMKVQKKISLGNREKKTIHLYFRQTGKVEISASETEDGKWVEAYHVIHPVEDGETQKYITNCWSKKSKECLRQIPVGKYVLKSKYNEFKKETPFEIKAGEVTKLNIIFGQTNKVEITASETEDGKWVKAFHAIHPVKDGETQRQINNCWSKKEKECLRQIPVGKYVLKSKYNEFKKETPFEIKAGEATGLNIVFGQTGKVEISASEKEGGKGISLYGYIYTVGENGKKNGGNVGQVNNRNAKEPSIHRLPAGKYIMNVKYNNFKKEVVFEVKAGEINKVHVLMGETGKVEITGSEKEGGKRVSLYGYIYHVDENGKKNGGNVGQVNNRNAKEPSIHRLPVGKYIMNVKYNDFKKEVVFEVKAGEANRVHVVFAPLRLSVKGAHMCSVVHHEVISDKGRVVDEIKATANKGAVFVLPDGTYTIESTVDGAVRKNSVIIGGANATKNVVVDFGGEEAAGSVEGVWKTSEGRATVHMDGIKLQGNYSSDNGELIGKMTYPQRFEGFWIENDSNTKCSEPKNGRYHWGKVVWEFDDNMCSFKGKWSYCDQKPSSGWRGIFLKSLPKEPTKEELIKADSLDPEATSVPKQEEQKSEKIIIGDKQIEIKDISQKDADKLKELGAILGAFGGMMQGETPEEQKKKEEKQNADNAKVDKEFDDMSKELEMFTK